MNWKNLVDQWCGGSTCPDFSAPRSTVLNGVLKLTNEVTKGELWCLTATVSSRYCRASFRRNEFRHRRQRFL